MVVKIERRAERKKHVERVHVGLQTFKMLHFYMGSVRMNPRWAMRSLLNMCSENTTQQRTFGRVSLLLVLAARLSVFLVVRA